jgi:hypothetical protein
MTVETWIYNKGKWIKANKLQVFLNSIKRWITKWKFVDSSKYRFIPTDELGRWFSLSEKEYIDSQKIYKEKGTIAYIFYPCGGIAWGVKVRVLDTSEEIDITDITCW